MPEQKDTARWSVYNYSPRGPYLVLIIDHEWWDANRAHIDEWFEKNCPICKPEPSDTIITFQDQGQYAMWQICWSG